MTPFQNDLKNQIEESPFSESFLIIPVVGDPFEIRGIFDSSIKIDEPKYGTTTVPRIMVFTVPEYETGKTIIHANGKDYKIMKHETDANIGSVIFLR